MSTANTSRITLELEEGADPIRGSIEHPDGTSQRFWGWLELSEQLRRVTADTPQRAARSARISPEPAPEPDACAKHRQAPTTRQEES